MSFELPTSYDAIYAEVRRLFDEYENQRIITVLLKAYIEDELKNEFNGRKIEAWLEPAIVPTKKTNQVGSYKTPDILLTLEYEEWLILDYKQIISTNTKTLNAHLEYASHYEQEFNFTHGPKNKIITHKIRPKAGIICPRRIASLYEELPVTITIIGSNLGSKIEFTTVVNNLGRRFKSFFRDKISLPPNSRDLATIKFLRHDPMSLSYTAQIITDVVLSLGKRAGSKMIETYIAELTDRLSGFYPAYLKNTQGFDIDQVTRGRVSKAVRFLHKIGYLELRGESIKIERSKGKMIDDVLEYLCEKEAQLILSDRLKIKRKKEETDTGGGTLDPFLNK